MPLLHQRLISARVRYLDQVVRQIITTAIRPTICLGVQTMGWRSPIGPIHMTIVRVLHLYLIELVPEVLIKQNASSCLLVGPEYLLAEHIYKLIEAQVHFGLDLIIQMSLPENSQRIHSSVVVQIQRVEHKLHEGLVLCLQNVTGQNPRHRHLNRELNLLAHGHLQIELPVPHLRQVTAPGQRVAEVEQVGPEEGLLVEGLNRLQMLRLHVLAQRFLALAPVTHQRLQHGSDHVQLGTRGPHIPLIV